jgi:hypothetical protein
MPDIVLDTAALCVGHIIEASSPSTLASIAAAAVAPEIDNIEFQRRFYELCRKMENPPLALLISAPGNIVPGLETLTIAPAIAALATRTTGLLLSLNLRRSL